MHEISKTLTGDELKRYCHMLYGPRRWQTALAEELQINGRTVRRWAAGDTAIPHSVAHSVRLMVFLDELKWLGEWRNLVAEGIESYAET